VLKLKQRLKSVEEVTSIERGRKGRDFKREEELDEHNTARGSAD